MSEMYVCAATGFIPFWLQFHGSGGVSVVCVGPFCRSEKPVHEFRDYNILHSTFMTTTFYILHS